MQQITPYSGYNSTESVFQYQSWQNGFIRLSFENEASQQEELKDWTTIQPFKRQIGVIALLHCPSTPNLEQAFFQYQQVVKRYGSSVVARCWAFDIQEKQMENGEVLKRLIDGGMEIFPQEHQLDDGTMAVDFHMEVVMTNMCTAMLQSFELKLKETFACVKEVETQGKSTPNDHTLNTLVNGMTYPSDANHSSTNKLLDSKPKKRKLCRLYSHIASICLLAGTPKDAIKYYRMAIEENKTANDPIWYAINLQGLAMAHACEKYNEILLEQWPDVDSLAEKPSCITEAVDSLVQSLKILGNERNANIVPLEMELALAAASYLTMTKGGTMVDVSATNILVDTFRSVYGKSKDKMVRLEFAKQSAIMCRSVGKYKMHTLFVMNAAKILAKMDRWEDAFKLVLGLVNDLEPLPKCIQGYDPSKYHHWGTIRIYILEHVVEFLGHCPDVRAQILFAIEALNAMTFKLNSLATYFSLSKTSDSTNTFLNLPNVLKISQQTMYDELSSLSNSLDYTLHLKSVRFIDLEAIILCDLVEELNPTIQSPESDVKEQKTDDTFLYSPFSNEKPVEVSQSVTWVENEFATIELSLTNHLPADVVLQSIHFITEPENCLEQCPISLVLEAGTTGISITQSVRPLISGTVIVKACKIEMESLTFDLAIHERDSSVLKANVLPSIPTLDVKETLPQTDEAVTIIQGESMEGFVVLENTGTEAVQNIQVSVNRIVAKAPKRSPSILFSTLDTAPKEDINAMAWKSIEQNVQTNKERNRNVESNPILCPGQDLVVPICLKGMEDLKQVSICILYTGTNVLHQRKLKVVYSLNVVHSLRVISANMFKFTDDLSRKYKKHGRLSERCINCPTTQNTENSIKESTCLECLLVVEVENPTSKPFYLEDRRIRNERPQLGEVVDNPIAVDSILVNANTSQRVAVATKMNLCDNCECQFCESILELPWWLPHSDTHGALTVSCNDLKRNFASYFAIPSLSVHMTCSEASSGKDVSTELGVEIEANVWNELHLEIVNHTETDKCLSLKIILFDTITKEQLDPFQSDVGFTGKLSSKRLNVHANSSTVHTLGLLLSDPRQIELYVSIKENVVFQDPIMEPQSSKSFFITCT